MRQAAEKVFKYSSQTRSGPINGKCFFDDSEICHVGHCPHVETDKARNGWELGRFDQLGGSVEADDRMTVREEGSSTGSNLTTLATLDLVGSDALCSPFSC